MPMQVHTALPSCCTSRQQLWCLQGTLMGSITLPLCTPAAPASSGVAVRSYYVLQDVAQSNAFAHKRIDELLHLQNTTFLQLQSLQEW